MNHPNQTDLERIRQTERRRALVRKRSPTQPWSYGPLWCCFPYWMLLTSVKSYGSYNAEHTGALYPVSHLRKL